MVDGCKWRGEKTRDDGWFLVLEVKGRRMVGLTEVKPEGGLGLTCGLGKQMGQGWVFWIGFILRIWLLLVLITLRIRLYFFK